MVSGEQTAFGENCLPPEQASGKRCELMRCPIVIFITANPPAHQGSGINQNLSGHGGKFATVPLSGIP